MGGHALPDIPEPQVRALAAALPTLRGQWSLGRQESYDGSVLLLIMPEDDSCATFVVDGDAGALALGVLRDDVLRPCGRFETMAAVITALGQLCEAEIVRAAGCRPA